MTKQTITNRWYFCISSQNCQWTIWIKVPFLTHISKCKFVNYVCKPFSYCKLVITIIKPWKCEISKLNWNARGSWYACSFVVCVWCSLGTNGLFPRIHTCVCYATLCEKRKMLPILVFTFQVSKSGLFKQDIHFPNKCTCVACCKWIHTSNPLPQ